MRVVRVDVFRDACTSLFEGTPGAEEFAEQIEFLCEGRIVVSVEFIADVAERDRFRGCGKGLEFVSKGVESVNGVDDGVVVTEEVRVHAFVGEVFVGVSVKPLLGRGEIGDGCAHVQ